MKQLAFAFALVACTGEGTQIVIQLDGPVTATTVEIVFADPHVYIKRNQRANNPPLDPATEPAFYVVQRRKLEVILGDTPQPVDDVELQVVGADRLLPIAIAKDEQGQIVGMGVLDPPSVFFDRGDNTDNFATNLEERADVTRYAIRLEPVTADSFNGSAAPVSIGSGHIYNVVCRDNMAPVDSGLVWRPESIMDGANPQLRIALPIDGSDDALFRFESTGFDLDCDSHTPGERGIDKGDEADCDDTSPLVTGDPAKREQCDQIDSDCDESTMGATVMPNSCGTCLGNKLTCYEGGTIGGTGCVDTAKCVLCKVHVELEEVGMAPTGCHNLGEIAAPQGCADQCVMRIVTEDPNWDIRIGEEVDSLFFGPNQAFTPVNGKFKFGAIPTANAALTPGATALGGFMIAYQIVEDGPVLAMEIAFNVDQSTTHTGAACADPEVVPPCGPDF